LNRGSGGHQVHPIIYLNGTMVDAAKARVAPVSSAMLYGRGLFSTVAIENGRSFLWSRHWERLVDHAGRLSIELDGHDQVNVGAGLQKLITVNKVNEGRARVILLARSGRDIWKARMPGAGQTDLLILTAAAQKVPPDGLTLAVSPYRSNSLSPLAGIKSLNYLDHVLAWEEAQARDFDEAVTLNERGEIVSATMANLFWVTEGTVRTPALNSGAIPGVTRACVIELAAKHFFPLVEGPYEMSDLTEADEIFLTASGMGVVPVTTFDFRRYAVGAGSVTARLQQLYRELISAECGSSASTEPGAR
jgi:branched-chain amino acid aminotransferase